MADRHPLESIFLEAFGDDEDPLVGRPDEDEAAHAPRPRVAVGPPGLL